MMDEIKVVFNLDASHGRAAGIPDFATSSLRYLLIDFNEPAFSHGDRW